MARTAIWPGWPDGYGAETGDRDIYRWYQVADALHGNFYEDETTPEDIEDTLNDVERCSDKLEPVLD